MNLSIVLDNVVRAGEAVSRASWQASVLAGLILAIHLVCGRRIPARWRHAMWVLVLVRLALPVVPSSPLSIYNLAPDSPAHTPKPPIAAVEIDLASVVASSTTVVSVQPPSSAQSTPAPPVDLWERWPQVLAAVWAGGILLLAARIGWATLRVSRTMRRLQRIDDEDVLTTLRCAAAELRVRRLPILLTGDESFSPALVGFVRPRLLLPRDLIARFDRGELRLVLLHELAHLKRRDVATNWLATALATLHWPNPVVWLVARRLRLERELACDELVLSHSTSDADRRAYGHTIVRLLETFSRAARPMPGSVGILEGKHQMKRRITMIARFAKAKRMWTVAAALTVVGLGVVALTDAVRAQQPATDSPKDKPTQTNVVADPGAATSAPSAPVASDGEGRSHEDAVIRAQMERTLPEVSFDGVPLGDVVDFLRDVTTVNIFVNWRALEAAGIDRAAPVTLKLRDIAFGDALDLILADVGGDTVRLEYVVEKKVIHISTAEELAKKMKLVIYDVSDLAPDATVVGTSPAPTTQPAGARPAATTATPSAASQKGEQLIKLVQEMVERDSWVEEGGNGAISMFDGRLVVVQTAKGHDKVAEFLEKMRAAKAKRPS